MKRSYAAAALCVFANFAQLAPAQDYDQEWRLKAGSKPGHVNLAVERSKPGSRSSHSSDVPVERFRGFSMDALQRGGPAKFEYVQDAGRLVCKGHFTSGRGIGTFEFVPNPQFGAELQKLGYEAPEESRLFHMMLSNITLEFARGLKTAGVAASTKDLYDMGIHGVTLDYVNRMRSNGYTNLTGRDFIQMRIHGVSPELVAELKKAGFDVPAKQVVEMKIHGVSPEYIRELHSYGIKPTAKEVVNLRIHGVSPEFMKESKELGYAFTAKELTDMRIHGVNGAYLRKLKDSGLKNLTADKIVKLRIHGID